MSAPWFGVADNARDGGKTPPQIAFSVIDQRVRRTNRQGGIDLAMEINNLSICRFANADIVHLAQTGDFGGKYGQGFADFSNAGGCCIAPSEHDRQQRLDVSLTLRVGTEFFAD